MINLIWIPGWKLKIKKENIRRYKISLDYPMSIDSLRYYITSGEYTINIPFSIFQDENEDFGIIFRDIDDVNEFSFLISSNLIIIKDEISEPWSIHQLRSIDLFLKLYIEFLIVKNSNGIYLPAKEVRSCLKKYSKGRISKRGEPIDSIDSDFPYRTRYELCEAEEFGVIDYENEEFILTYIPRYEIHDSILNFPQNEYIMEKINKKWEDVYCYTIEKFQDRLNKISILIESLLVNDNYVNIIKSKIIIQEKKLSYPNLQSIILNGEKSFSDLLKEEILTQMKEKLSIRIIIDKTIELKNKDKKILNNFLDHIKQYFNVISIEDLKLNFNIGKKFDDNNLEFDTNSDINSLFILNNLEMGSQSIYDEIKQRFSLPHKVLTLKTISESEEYEIQFILIYLSLKFRISYRNYLKIQNDNNILISFNISKHFDLGYCCIFSSVLIDQKHIVNNSLLPLTYNNNTFIKEKVSEFIFNEITKIKKQVQNKNLIIVYKNNLDLKTYINNAIEKIQDIYVTEVLDIPFKIFKVSDDNIQIPKNGSYFIISKDNEYTNICLISNGYPDNPKKGIPNPILIKINSKDDSTIYNILNSFFSHSFLHPTSLIKPNLPIELYQILNIFNIPIISILNQEYQRFLL